MKKFLFAIAISALLLSCQKLTTSQLNREVRKSMRETFIKEGQIGVSIVNLTLVHEEGNYYTGVVRLRYDGGTYEHAVNVVYDGDSFAWEILD